ncbi:MAG: Rab family GTPase [Candidatus Thorarchaeota archaeon]
MTLRDPDYVHKIVVLGETGVGKTSLVQRYAYGSLDPQTQKTIGAVLHVKMVDHRSLRHKLVIWDLAGAESFLMMREQFCTSASGAFLVFDTTQPSTLAATEDWLEALYTSAGRVPVVLVENKVDLESRVDPQVVKRIAEEHAFRLVRTSALHNINVQLAFVSLVDAITERLRD